MAKIIHRVEKLHEVNRVYNEQTRTASTYKNNVDLQKKQQNICLECLPMDSTPEKYIADNYKVRKNAVKAFSAIYTASPDFFNNLSQEQQLQFFNDCLDFHKNEYGGVIISADIHLDEKTPHLHILTIPDKDGKLQAKNILGGPAELREHQTNIANTVGRSWGLERGKEHSTAIHKSTHDFIKEEQERLSAKSAQLKQIEHDLDIQYNDYVNIADNLEIKREQIIKFYKQVDKLKDDINAYIKNERLSISEQTKALNAFEYRIKQLEQEQEEIDISDD